MTKLTQLTPEQKARISSFREECLMHGLSTKPIDREKAKDAICRAYEERGEKRPKYFFFAESPLGASFLCALLRWSDDTDYNIDGLSIEELRQRYLEIPKAERPPLERPEMRGQLDFSWLGHYQFLEQVLGLKWSGTLEPHIDVAKNCGWWMSFPEVAIISNRPEALFRDAENRLHHDSRSAISFRDGWELYFWHGTAVPKEWITEKNKFGAKDVFGETNAELRRCLAEILEWRFLDDLNPVIIDKDSDPMIGTLLEVDLPGFEGQSSKERFLKVKCGTGRDFIIPVAPDSKTALEANASTYGINPKELLNLEVRT